jgi:hypothetical protein
LTETREFSSFSNQNSTIINFTPAYDSLNAIAAGGVHEKPRPEWCSVGQNAQLHHEYPAVTTGFS